MLTVTTSKEREERFQQDTKYELEIDLLIGMVAVT
jgi:hypothetical protein